MNDEELLNKLKERYQPGTRVIMHSERDPYSRVPIGMMGTVGHVDDAGIHVTWDNGSMLALHPEYDTFAIIQPKREFSTLKLYMPLNCEFRENLDDEPTILNSGEAAKYVDAVRAALERLRIPQEDARGLMFWRDADSALADKVRSAVLSAEVYEGKLWTVAECEISDDMTATDFRNLTEFLADIAKNGMDVQMAKDVFVK